MLTHRTNVLLSKEDYHLLSQLARQHGKSRGHFLRLAFKQTYHSTNSRQTAVNELKKLQKHFDSTGLTPKKIKAMINHERKH